MKTILSLFLILICYLCQAQTVEDDVAWVKFIVLDSTFQIEYVRRTEGGLLGDQVQPVTSKFFDLLDTNDLDSLQNEPKADLYLTRIRQFLQNRGF